MFFKQAGDVEQGHKHHYHHATLISSGSVKYEILDSDCNTVISSKVFAAPAFVFVNKDDIHRITALEPNTVCACIHALRDESGELLEPDYLISEFDATNRPHTLGIPSDTKNVTTMLGPITNRSALSTP